MSVTLELLRFGLGGVLVVLGLVLMLGGVIGVLRFPDIYTRIHAAAADSIGGVLAISGLAFVSGEWGSFARLMLLAALVGFLGPTLSQIVANAAHTGGLAPLAGRYQAPRPGARRESPP